MDDTISYREVEERIFRNEYLHSNAVIGLQQRTRSMIYGSAKNKGLSRSIIAA